MNRGKLLITKQKRLIATRLIQITLLVDDYLYHGKPMSARSAKAYIREITAFKDKCYQDVRSLQVIEKLTRFMKGIIEEQQEIHGQAGTEDSTFTYKDSLDKVPLSPVYSIADEDTQYLEEFKENDKETVPDKITTEEDNDTQTTTDARDPIGTNDIVMDLCDDENVHVSKDNTLFPKYSIVDEDLQDINDIFKELDKDSLPNKILTDEKDYTKTAKVATDPVVNMEVLNICDNDNAEALKERNIHEFHNEELNMHRALSNLSIRDIEEVFEVPFFQECSQSILDKFYPHSIANTGTPLTQNNASTAIVTQRPEPETDKVVFNDKTIKIALPQKNKQLNIKPTTIENRKNSHKISKPRNQKPSNTRNKNKTLNALLETVATKVSDSVTIKKCAAKVTNTKPKAQKQKNVKAETATKQFINEYQNHIDTIQQPNITYANQCAPYEKGNMTHFDHPKHLQTTTKGIKFGEKCHVPIYSSFVINDLSWIENIRFVREIPNEEYESFVEGKDFWNSSSLPQNYNEENFNY